MEEWAVSRALFRSDSFRSDAREKKRINTRKTFKKLKRVFAWADIAPEPSRIA